MEPFIISEHYEFDKPIPEDRGFWYALCNDKKAFWDGDLMVLRENLRKKGYSDLACIIGSYVPGELILSAV